MARDMNGRILVTLILMILLQTGLATAGYHFRNHTANGRIFFLSEEATDIRTAENICTSQLSATLATFDNNTDFKQSLVTLHQTSFTGEFMASIYAWISLAAKQSSINGNAYSLSWKTEEIQENLWTFGTPAGTCKEYEDGKQCCVTMFMSIVFAGLKDKDCTSEFRFMCRLDLVNECNSDKPPCSQTCKDKGVGFECGCRIGYDIASDNVTCNDVDECELLNICDRNSSDTLGNLAYTCSNTIGSYSCSCSVGFEMSVNGKSCEDIDECSTTSNTCEHSCNNTVGSFHCTCFHGYGLDADRRHCQDVNECDVHNGKCHQICVNLPASYQCSCSEGFILSHDNKTCKDVDECATDTHNCEQICANTNGAYECSCYEGYVLQDSFSCVDLDECSENSSNLCMHSCSNINGSYMCSCREGFELLSDNTSCSDIDECHVYSHPCQHMWVTTAGEFTCSFKPGSSFEVDTSPCFNRHTCNTTVALCSNPCKNTIGGYSCSCPHGFENNGSVCIDIDECSQIKKRCSHKCTNSPGSYSCICPLGFRISKSKKTQCVDIDECQDNLAGCDQVCLNTRGSYECSCFHGYKINSTDETSCNDVDECIGRRNPCTHVCINSLGSFSCHCYTGFVLGSDNVSCSEVHSTHLCPCWCSSLSHHHSSATVMEDTYNLQQYLRVNYQTLSTTERRKTSAGDERTSSHLAGLSLFLFVAVPFGLIIIADISRLVHQVVINYMSL